MSYLVGFLNTRNADDVHPASCLWGWVASFLQHCLLPDLHSLHHLLSSHSLSLVIRNFEFFKSTYFGYRDFAARIGITPRRRPFPLKWDMYAKTGLFSVIPSRLCGRRVHPVLVHSLSGSLTHISKTWFSHVDRHSASANIIVYHSYTPNLARCPSAPQRSTALCGRKLMLHSTTETCAVTIGCYRGLHFLGSPHRESNYKYARFQWKTHSLMYINYYDQNKPGTRRKYNAVQRLIELQKLQQERIWSIFCKTYSFFVVFFVLESGVKSDSNASMYVVFSSKLAWL